MIEILSVLSVALIVHCSHVYLASKKRLDESQHLLHLTDKYQEFIKAQKHRIDELELKVNSLVARNSIR